MFHLLKPPTLIPISQFLKWAHSPAVLLVMVGVALYWVYRFVYRTLGKMSTLASFAVFGAAVYAVIRLHQIIASWQKGVLHPASPKTVHSVAHPPSPRSGISNPLASGQTPTSGVNGFNLDAMNPLAHENPWVVAIVLIVAVLGLIVYLVYRGMSPTKKAEFLTRLHANEAMRVPKQKPEDAEFQIVGIEVGVRKDNGKPIRIDGKDRFINTLILGSIGTGKTSRILLKGVYQDLHSIANGVSMDVMILDPDGEFAQSAVHMAKKLNVHIDVMDLRGSIPSTVSFNPFKGGDIADIIDNVRAALQEKMGKQDSFFQNAQDDLVRTVIQVQVPLWPETDFLQFADLVTDPLHFRSVCTMVTDYATQKVPTTRFTPKKTGKKSEEPEDEFVNMWEYERPQIQTRFDAMSPTVRSMVLSAARSFLMDTRTEQKMEKLETITKGLKIVVNELATNPRLQDVFSSKKLPTFDFKSFLATGKEERGRLLVVVTGNRPSGVLFGKLFLVALKMYTLDRGGTENTRRPVYLYIDEFARFGTESFTEMFSQARKYRVGMTLAIQARAQLLDVSKKFQDVVEGSCRNKIYFPAPSPDDARFLEHSLGTKKNVKETHSENKLNWLFFDDRNLDRRVSTQESIDPRYRLEDIAYGLNKEEAIFSMTVDNQTLQPCIGMTSYADVWVAKRRNFFRVAKTKPNQPDQADARTQRTPWHKTIATRSVALMKTQWNKPTKPKVAVEESVSVSQRSSSLQEIPQQSVYVKPTAQPDAVISMETLLQSRQEPPAQGHSEPLTGTVQPAPQPQVTRIDLRRKTTTVESPSSTATESRSEPERTKAIQCPNCQQFMELIDTGAKQKWRCPVCGHERRKR